MPVLISLLKAFPHFLSFYFMLKVNPYLTLIILATTRGNNTCFLISLKKSESFEQIIFTVSFNWRLWRETSSSKPFHNLLLRKTKASKFYFSSSAAGTTVPLSFLSSEGVRNCGSRSSQRLSLLDAPCQKRRWFALWRQQSLLNSSSSWVLHEPANWTEAPQSSSVQPCKLRKQQ